MSTKIDIQICKHALDMLLERNGKTEYVETTKEGTFTYKSNIEDSLDECKIIGNRIIWRILKANFDMKFPGRWRDHPLDEKITFKVVGKKVRITINSLEAKGTEAFDLET